MDFELVPPKDINGINLSNYVPQQKTFNSIVLLHKRYLNKPIFRKEDKFVEAKPKKGKHDKGLQVSYDKATEISKETYKINNTNGILEQTIKFAKDITPLVIPPNENRSPVFYTIKASKKHRKSDKKQRDSDHIDAKYDKNEQKKVVETYRKVRKESFSVRESVSHSTNNTLDDLNIHPSLCCSFSEVSEKKHHKKEKNHTKKHEDAQKILVSESFEAIATENILGDTKIKIHLMNEKDKHFLSESIKIPVLNAIRECILESNTINDINTEITTVQRMVKGHEQKLDNVMQKLTSIERKLDTYIEDTRILSQEMAKHKVRNPPPKQISPATPKLVSPKELPLKIQAKPSALEEIGEDFAETKEDYSSEEELHQERLDRRSKSAVIMFSQDDNDINKEIMGGGEAGLGKVPQVKPKPDRPNRIPARFCWTDAVKK